MAALRRLFKRHKIALAYIYGSCATGRTHARSDMDIALVSVRPLSAPQRLRMRLKLASDASALAGVRDADICFFEDMPLEVQYEVIRDGIVLLNTDEDRRIGLEHRTMSLYLDRRYYMQRHAQELITRVAQRGILR